MQTNSSSYDTVVIGGGLAGLIAAIELSHRGQRVLVLERQRSLGGRAKTSERDGFAFNEGAHALYRGGALHRTLRELDIDFSGGVPSGRGSLASCEGRLSTLPVGFLSLLSTDLLGLAEKLSCARLLAKLRSMSPEPYATTTVEHFLTEHAPTSAARALMEALVRLSTYAHDPAKLSAGTAIRQMQLAMNDGVLYVDGGWRTLVEGLLRVAERQGVVVRSGARVLDLRIESGQAVGVRLEGESIACRGVVLAVPPKVAGRLLGSALGDDDPLVTKLARPPEVHAHALDLGFVSLPQPARTFLLGIDEPVYVSVHTAHAKLAREGHVVHAVRYLSVDDDATPARCAAQLRAALDRFQPGFRDHVVSERTLPNIVVTGWLPLASEGGERGRPDVCTPLSNVWLAGDWVGPEGCLSDAAAASGRRAAESAGTFAAAA